MPAGERPQRWSMKGGIDRRGECGRCEGPSRVGPSPGREGWHRRVSQEWAAKTGGAFRDGCTGRCERGWAAVLLMMRPRERARQRVAQGDREEVLRGGAQGT